MSRAWQLLSKHARLSALAFGFLSATGSSGHGSLQGPAVGEAVRDLYLGCRPLIDVSALSASRFDHDTPRKELNCV